MHYLRLTDNRLIRRFECEVVTIYRFYRPAALKRFCRHYVQVARHPIVVKYTTGRQRAGAQQQSENADSITIILAQGTAIGSEDGCDFLRKTGRTLSLRPKRAMGLFLFFVLLW